MNRPARWAEGACFAVLCSACAGPVLTPTPDSSFRTSAPELMAGPRLTIPVVHRAVLDNGLSVFSIESPETATLRLAFADRLAEDGGDASSGIAALTASVIRSGTVLEGDGIARGDGSLGEQIGGSVNGSGTAFQVVTLPSDAAHAFESLGRLVQNPTFDAAAFSRARRAARAHYAWEAADVFVSLRRLAAHALFSEANFYTHFSSGTEQERARITDDAVRHFYASRFQPASSALLVVGPLSATEDLALATKTFGAWRPAPASPSLGNESWVSAPEAKRPSGVGVSSPAQDASLVALLPCPQRNSPDSVAADLSATLLGELWGSGLLARLRHESGSTYFTAARCNQIRTGGIFEISLDTSPEQFSVALGAIEQQLVDLARTPVDPNELAEARALYLGNLAIRYSTNAGLEDILYDQFMNDLPNDYTAQLEARVNATTPHDIQAFAQRYLDRHKMVVAAEGAPQSLGESLARLGNTRWLTVSQVEHGE